ncbi:MAG: hypothetical protein AAB037_01070, partial [Chloroflexota bacterium]
MGYLNTGQYPFGFDQKRAFAFDLWGHKGICGDVAPAQVFSQGVIYYSVKLYIGNVNKTSFVVKLQFPST